MKVLDLFSGIGGFSLGLERAGMQTVAFCEYDEKARLVLKKHWPEVPIYNDVRELNGRQFEGQSIDLICGGFPCQPYSVAGDRLGEKDDRHLWPEYFRLIQEIRPAWIIGENVFGIVNLFIDSVLSDLESAGYRHETLIIPACAVNAPHRRERVWIVGYSEQHGSSAPEIGRRLKTSSRRSQERENLSLQFEGTGGRKHNEDVAYPVSSPKGTAHRKRTSRITDKKQNNGNQFRNDSGDSGETLAHPIGKRGCGGNDPREYATDADPCGETLRPGEHFDWWSVEPDVCRVAHGISNRVDRLKQLGNAVIPQIPELIGRAIMAVEAQPCK